MKFPDRDVLIDPCNGVNKTNGISKNQIRSWLTVLMVGLVALIVGLRPDLFGLDRGLYIGFYQILLILLGIGLMSLGASNTLKAFWGCNDRPLRVDIGSRTVATGYVICFFTALADAFGFGTNSLPEVLLGTLQSRGVILGMIVICIGLIMIIRFKVPENETLATSSD